MGLKADFTKAFPDGFRVEAAFELDLERPGITVLFGASGCGKTTVLRCLAGLDDPDAGMIAMAGERWFGGESTPGLPPPRRRLGYVFQEAALFPHLDVAQNVAFGLMGWSRPEREARVKELVERVGLEGLERRRPSGLSGGEKQRVALARALAPRPRLLLLDEPFASLDRPAAAQLRQALKRSLGTLGVPAILVTHDQEEALALGDGLLLMHEGRILPQGSHRNEEGIVALHEVSEFLGLGKAMRARAAGG